MPRLLNWEILGNPYNWFVIWFIVLLPVLVVTAYHQAKGNV